jgi:uncharacterized caspase-like protein
MLRAVIALLILLVPSVAHAEKRIALLIGNKDYKAGVGALANPLNDIRIVGEALKAVGFEVLKPAQNARRAEMLIAIHEFASKLKAAGTDAVGFLYYSGHGIASAGENYLIPVDIDEPSTVQLSVQGVKQSEVLAILRNEAPNAAHYLILDACRNTLQGARGGKGFVPVGQQSGVLVGFATEPGKTASDTGQESGPYAAALAAELVKPDQSDLIMFHHVRVAVMEKTGGDQVPWTEDGIQRRERVQFGGASNPAQFGLSAAEREWQQYGKDTKDIELLKAFKNKHNADPFYVRLAETRIEELRRQQTAAATPQREYPAVQSTRSSKAILPGHGIGPLSVGMVESEIAGFLGKSDERNIYDDGKTVYLSFFKQGLSIRLVDGRVTATFAYAGRSDQYGPTKYVRYEGVFDNGLTMDSTYAEVLKKLGVPQKSLGDTEKWISYKQGIGFQFDNAGKITHVVVTAPD